MPIPLLLFRVGHMRSYDGPAEITGGGSHVVENGSGGEMWNFAPDGGRCFGYVMSRAFAGIDIGRLSESPPDGWRAGDELASVDIGFFARGQGGSHAIVGAFVGATVYHKRYYKRPDPAGGGARLDYCCEIDNERAILVPEGERSFEVPSATVHGKGLPGQSNVWYGQRGTAAAAALTESAGAYIRALLTDGRRLSVRTHARRARTFPDQATALALEEASMRTVKAHFEQLGHRVDDVHRDCCGWDLTATASGRSLRIEVKAHLGDVVMFELTPNEYARMREMPADYRVCLVRSALTSTDVEVFEPIETADGSCAAARRGSSCASGSARRLPKSHEHHP